MANMHLLFLDFDSEIKLSTTKSDDLRRGRDALREDVKGWFSDNSKQAPSFCWQGSFAMKTTVNPINGTEYDIDDGVYLNGYDCDQDEWPSTVTVHSWVKTATDDRTSQDSIDKNTCVRICYAAGYHIDLPIYIMKDDVAYLAHKSKGWIESDPKAFTDWFIGLVKDQGEQLRRIVRYLKAWKDYDDVPLKGIELTILAANNYDSFVDRDDKALKNTLANIILSLERSYSCRKPVAPYEDLFESHSETKQKTIIAALKRLKTKIEAAIAEKDEEQASLKLREVLGDRFPKGEPNATEKYERTSAPGVLRHDGRSG